MPGILKDLYDTKRVAHRLNFYLLKGFHLQTLSTLEVLERTGGELFYDFEAFSSLSNSTVKFLAALNRYFVPESVLISAVVYWATVRSGPRHTTREILTLRGLMDKIRWGLLDPQLIAFHYGFLFTAEEIEALRKSENDPMSPVTFINMSQQERGLGNAQADGICLLSQPPLEACQLFKNDSPNNLALRLHQVKICSRIHSYTRKGALRTESAHIELTTRLTTRCGIIKTKPCHTNVFDMEEPITCVVMSGEELVIRIVFNIVGKFTTVEQTECHGFSLVTLTQGIIQELHGTSDFI